MRTNRLIGVAYAEALGIYMGGGKSPCLCADIRKQISQHQRYPMAIEIYENNINQIQTPATRMG